MTSAVGEVGRALVGHLWRVALLGLGVLIVLFLFSLLTPDPAAAFVQCVAYVGVAATIVAAVIMILTFRCARAIEAPALVAAMATTVATAGAGLAAAAPPSFAAALAAIAVGLGFGAYWSTTMILQRDGDGIRARGTLWYLAVWAITVAINQAMSGGGVSPYALGALGLLFSSALSIGVSLGLIVRARRATAAPAG